MVITSLCTAAVIPLLLQTDCCVSHLWWHQQYWIAVQQTKMSPEYSRNNWDASCTINHGQPNRITYLSKQNQISIAYCQIESFDSQIESQHASNRNLNRIAIWFCPPVLTIMLKMFACVLFIAQNFLQCLIRQVLWRALSIESTAKSLSRSYDNFWRVSAWRTIVCTHLQSLL